MVLLFGTLLRFVILFIDIFFDCCIFDNNVYHKFFFYLICTFSCVNLRFCSWCVPLRSLTSLFPLQTGSQTCGAMLRLLQRCKMFLLILCVISKLFYKLQLAMAMTTFIIRRRPHGIRRQTEMTG